MVVSVSKPVVIFVDWRVRMGFDIYDFVTGGQLPYVPIKESQIRSYVWLPILEELKEMRDE